MLQVQYPPRASSAPTPGPSSASSSTWDVLSPSAFVAQSPTNVLAQAYQAASRPRTSMDLNDNLDTPPSLSHQSGDSSSVSGQLAAANLALGQSEATVSTDEGTTNIYVGVKEPEDTQ